MTRPAAHQGPRRAAPRSKAQATGLLEAHVQQTCVQFLELDGWRAFKMEAQSDRSLVTRFMARVNAHALLRPLAQIIHHTIKNVMRAAGVGEPGMPDYLFVRYLKIPEHPDWWSACAQVLWIEFKRPGEKPRPRPDQLAWHEAERARGALVMVVDDIDWFRTWYRESGLRWR